MPQFDVNGVHSISLACSPERALELVLAAPAAPGRAVAMLFRTRGLPRATTVHELFGRMGFSALSTTSTEVVLGACATPWRPSAGVRPFADECPGAVRVAADIRATAVAGGCILSTETRVQACDDETRRAFRRYWFVVGPFSALTRRCWLRAAEEAMRGDGCGGAPVRN